MTEMMSLIEQERLKTPMSSEMFAHRVGMTSTTYSRQKNGRQAIGLDSIQAYARYFRETGNVEILKALMAYVFSLEPDQISIKE